MRPGWHGFAIGQTGAEPAVGCRYCVGETRARGALGERATSNLCWRICPGQETFVLVRRSVRIGRFQYQASTRGAGFRGGWRGKWLKGQEIKS